MSAEWHFFATSHGKGPCDGLGGTLKRLAARASLQRPYENQILTPIEFFNFCDKDIKQIDVVYTTHDQYQAKAELLEERHLTATTIAGTQKLHSFIPVNCSTLEVRFFSDSLDSQLKKVCQTVNTLQMEDITGYITVAYDNKWWLGVVINKNISTTEVEVTFLHPSGPARSFKYPEKPDNLIVSVHDILSVVETKTSTGRVYTVTQLDQSAASQLLEKNIANQN